MFKKTKLAAALAVGMIGTLGVMSSAQAVHVSDNQLGQVLIFPYYNVNNGFQTNISFTNTSGKFKAVKVRFRESKNSNDVLDFNVYMSPNDTWTATVRLNAGTGKANIITTDETCTYPDKALLQAGVDFIDLYDDVDAEDVREGYVEVIDMGDIADGAGPAFDGGGIAEINVNGANVGVLDGTNDRSIPAGLLHGADGIPADCSVVADAWVNNAANQGGFTRGNIAGGATFAGQTSGVAVEGVISQPYDNGNAGNHGGDLLNGGLVASRSSDLLGTSILLDTNTGSAFVAEPAAISGYSIAPQHYQSDDSNNYLLPSLASGDQFNSFVPLEDSATGFSTNRTVGAATWTITNNDWGLVDSILPNPPRRSGSNPFPIAHVLAANGVANTYFVDPAFSASTDWVVTNPMKKHGIWADAMYTEDLDDDATYEELDDTGLAAYGARTAVSGAVAAGFTNGDIEVGITNYDREEQQFTPAPGTPGFSPVIIGTPNVTLLPNEVNIVAFVEAGGTNTPVLGTTVDNLISYNLTAGFVEGWAQMTFASRYDLDATAGGATASPFSEYHTGTTYPSGAGVDAPAARGLGGGLPATTGVPAIGFAATRAKINGDDVGETFPHAFMSFDRDF